MEYKSPPREFGRIQRGRRVALSKALMNALGWEVGDQVLLEAYRGRIIIENLSRSIRPPEERLRNG